MTSGIIRRLSLRRPSAAWALGLGLLVTAGCNQFPYAPVHHHGIPANELPDIYRTPCRTGGPILNLASLTLPPQADYILGPGDVLEITVAGLYQGSETRPVRVQIVGNGDVQLPMVGPVKVGGMNVMQAQQAITKAYSEGFINDSRINVYLVERATTDVLVMGEVTTPGVYRLPKYENDVAHAIAMAGGLKDEAGLLIEVHRRLPPDQARRAALYEQIRPAEPNAKVELLPDSATVPAAQPENAFDPNALRVVRIPLRGFAPEPWTQEDIVLHSGDVVVVPSRQAEVFFVVGKLNTTNFVRFNVGLKERDLGAGFMLPRDREVDAVQAVAMAGYIDPIYSPTTVTVHRTLPDGRPLLILVDLIKARYDRRETVLVQAGDIIYLNPDGAWYGRQTFDRMIGSLLSVRYTIPN